MSEAKETTFQPSPESLQEARERFSKLKGSHYAPLLLPEPNVPGRVADALGAWVMLPGNELLKVGVTTTADRLRMEFDRLPTGWRLASVSLFTPTAAEQPLIRLGNLATPLEPAEADYRLAADSEEPDAEEDYYLFEADTDVPEAWQTEWADGGQGLQVRLEQDAASRNLNIHCQLRSSGERPPVVRYRVGWADEQGVIEFRELGEIRFKRGRNDWWEGYASPGFNAEEVREAPGFELRLSREITPDVDCLDAHEFLEVVGDDHQVLILTPVSEMKRPTFEAEFYSDEQRRLWLNPSASRMLCLQPA